MKHKNKFEIPENGKTSIYLAKNTRENVREIAEKLDVTNAQQLFNALVENYNEKHTEKTVELRELENEISLLNLKNEGFKSMLEIEVSKCNKLETENKELYAQLLKIDSILQPLKIATNNWFSELDNEFLGLNNYELLELMVASCETEENDVFPLESKAQEIYEKIKKGTNEVEESK